jgi:glycine cleavage system H protein
MEARMANVKMSDKALNCIWVDAGVVSYKLCDMDFECENCSFDQVMRRCSSGLQGKKRQAKVVAAKSGVLLKDSESAGGGETLSAGSSIPAKTVSALITGMLFGTIPRSLPAEFVYSKNHLWAKRIENNRFRIGIDAYLTSHLNHLWGIILPQIGTLINRNAPLMWIILEAGTLVVRSPIGGRVSGANLRLKECACLVNTEPYGSGWICEIDVEKELGSAWFNNDAARALYDDQFSELEQGLISDFEEGQNFVGATMMDGGTTPKNLEDLLGAQRYISVLKKLLSL